MSFVAVVAAVAMDGIDFGAVTFSFSSFERQRIHTTWQERNTIKQEVHHNLKGPFALGPTSILFGCVLLSYSFRLCRKKELMKEAGSNEDSCSW
jgi:hypothetical protein